MIHEHYNFNDLNFLFKQNVKKPTKTHKIKENNLDGVFINITFAPVKKT